MLLNSLPLMDTANLQVYTEQSPLKEFQKLSDSYALGT